MRKLARFEVLRNWISDSSTSPKKSYRITPENSSLFKNLNRPLVVSSLNKDGYYLGINLSQEIVQEIRKFANSAICYEDRNPALGFYYRDKKQIEAKNGRQVQIASYLDNVEHCPAIKKLQNDPGLLAIAAEFLGVNPVLIGCDLWWSFPIDTTLFQQLKAAQVFHYDMDDYRFIKFFFYLTDVDLFSGPHICIRGSHQNKLLLHQLLGMRCASLEDDKIINAYGSENVVTICGKAGFGFVEDAYCFHKGSPPLKKERLLLQLEFAVNTYRDLRNF